MESTGDSRRAIACLMLTACARKRLRDKHEQYRMYDKAFIGLIDKIDGALIPEIKTTLGVTAADDCQCLIRILRRSHSLVPSTG